MSCDGGGRGVSSSLSSLPGNIFRLSPSPEYVLSSTIQCTDLARSKSLTSQPLSLAFGAGDTARNKEPKRYKMGNSCLFYF